MIKLAFIVHKMERKPETNYWQLYGNKESRVFVLFFNFSQQAAVFAERLRRRRAGGLDRMSSTHWFDGTQTKKLTCVFVMTGYEWNKINWGRGKFIIRNYLWNLLSSFYSVWFCVLGWDNWQPGQRRATL